VQKGEPGAKPAEPSLAERGYDGRHLRRTALPFCRFAGASDGRSLEIVTRYSDNEPEQPA